MSNFFKFNPRNDKQTQEDERFEEALKHLVIASLISAALLITAVTISNSETPHPDLFAICLAASLLIGTYSFMALIEIRIGRHLLQWKSTPLLWAVLIACLGYLAKARAVSDINFIFHTDASLFPMTLLAASLLHSAGMLFSLIAGAGIISFIFLLTAHRSKKGTAHAFMMFLCHTAHVFTCLVIAIFVYHKILNDSPRMQMFYRIAHAVDFNSFSSCKNLDPEAFSSVYIDANRYLVLVAPKINDTLSFEARKFSIFRSIKIPEAFSVQRCVY